MSKTLVILESPGKVKAISKYLGKNYNVIASNGHIIDLPEKELGVEVENDFKPKYTIIKNSGQAAKILKKIQEMAKSSERVLIATDPDREGEAIGWHIANKLKGINDKIFRVTFNEITQKGVKNGVETPGEINLDLVNAQQARRIMDRLVGYKVSPFLWKILSGGLSAGRVQSVALRLISERDGEINAFKPEEYWKISADFKTTDGKEFTAELVRINGKEFKLSSKEETDQLLDKMAKIDFSISSINKKKVKRTPPPPFITSTLLQESVKKLNFSSKKTMAVAQQLYEGIEIGGDGAQGLITYMRTDSTRISDDATKDLRDYLLDNYGKESLSPKVRVFKSKNNIQDAHEAVRPTNLKYAPKDIQQYLNREQLRLYQLIWNRFCATQMADAEFDQTTIEINGDNLTFRLGGRINTKAGYLELFRDMEGDDKDTKLPKGLKEGEELAVEKVDPNQHFTKPPARFNEASLTKELEELGIGRPSTYATIIDRLINQKYIEKSEKKLISTELGGLIVQILIKSFPDIFNVEFTKGMENMLDEIEFGNKNISSVLNGFYSPFSDALDTVSKKRAEIKKSITSKVGKNCPDCKEGELLYKWGKNGKFIACSNFPECKYTASLNSDGEIEVPVKKEKEIVGECEKCGGNMVVRNGRFGKFVACDNYPKCKNILTEKIDVDCPEEGCSGKLTERKSKRGKKFYGCDKYPDCKFVMWNKPHAKKCGNCGFPVMGENINTKTKETKFICPKCKHETE